MAESNYLELQGNSGYLVHYRGTSVELSNALGVTVPGDNQSAVMGSVLITGISSYYGRGPTDMWEWLRTRFEAGT